MIFFLSDLFIYILIFVLLLLLFRYALMLNCWNEEPDKRPTFSNLISKLQTLHAKALGIVSFLLIIINRIGQLNNQAPNNQFIDWH